MNNALSYNGYYGNVEYSREDKVFWGRIIGISDNITYEGVDVKSLEEDFQCAVEDYLEMCIEVGKEPEKTYKGSFNVRIEPTLHRQLAVYSASLGLSLNSAVEKAIREFIS